MVWKQKNFIHFSLFQMFLVSSVCASIPLFLVSHLCLPSWYFLSLPQHPLPIFLFVGLAVRLFTWLKAM